MRMFVQQSLEEILTGFQQLRQLTMAHGPPGGPSASVCCYTAAQSTADEAHATCSSSVQLLGVPECCIKGDSVAATEISRASCFISGDAQKVASETCDRNTTVLVLLLPMDVIVWTE